MYEKKVEDGFEVLEIPKGAWTEAIFAKLKPIEEKAKLDLDEDNLKIRDDEDDEDEDDDLRDDKYNDEDEFDEFDDDKLTEGKLPYDNRGNPEDLSLEAADVADDDDL